MDNPTTILERSLSRDACIRAAGHVPTPVAELHIVDFIAKHKLYDSEAATRWLVDRSSTPIPGIAARIVELISPMIECGYPENAVAVFSSVVGLEDANGGAQRRQEIFHVYRWIGHALKTLLKTPQLVSSHPNTWGTIVIRLLSLLILEEQQAQAACGETWFRSSVNGEPDYDGTLCYWYYRRRRGDRGAWVTFARAVEQGLTEAVGLSDKRTFCILADQLVAGKRGLAICQTLVALHDHIRVHSDRSWRHSEAIRLVGLAEVEGSHSALVWRRLLRRQLLPMLEKDEQDSVLTAVRELQRADRDRINELSDFEEYTTLTSEETLAIGNAREAGELFEPRDPRDDITEVVRPSHELPARRLENTWPYPEDRAGIRLLADVKQFGEDATADEMEASLSPRCDALNSILKRPEIDSPDWFGTILGWCARAIADIRRWYCITHGVTQDSEFDVSGYLELIERRTPLWEGRVTASLERLKQPPPKSHASYDCDGCAWSSDDPIAYSLEYLDEMLAVPIGSRLDVYRSNLAKDIVKAWDVWPVYTRALAITILRSYSWVTNESLTDLLVRELKTSTWSYVVDQSLRHLLGSRQSGIGNLMRTLIERIDDLSRPSDVVNMVGHVIGNAVARCHGDGEDAEELASISRLYNEVRADYSLGKSVRYSLTAGIMEGVRWHLGSLDRLDQTHVEVWLSMVIWALADWLRMGGAGRDDLPVSPITGMQDMRWDNSQQEFLLCGMTDVIVRVINEAGLGGFYEIHYELRKLLEDKQSEQGTLCTPVVRASLEPALITFCQASARRVAQWRAAGETTNDLVYVSGLIGEDTRTLVTLVFKTSLDRDDTRRALAPVIDILADAGLLDISNQLRRMLRYT